MVYVARMGETRNIPIFIGRPKEKRPISRSRSECMENVKMNLKEIRWESVN